MKLQQALEALIFAAPKPISAADLLVAVLAAAESSESEQAQAFRGVNQEGILEALNLLQQDFEVEERAFRLMEQATGWGFVTKPEYAPWVRKLYPETKPARLSGPALETLAIIAYRQPVTRADIEAVRGVAVDGVMAVLLDRSLVRIAGRAELPGRPLLYSTTGYFLEHFGLKSTQDLPNASELGRMNLPKAAVAEDKSGKRKGGEAAEPELPLQANPAPATVAAAEPGSGAKSSPEAVLQAEPTDGGQTVPESTASPEGCDAPSGEEEPVEKAEDTLADAEDSSGFSGSFEPAAEDAGAGRFTEVALVQEAPAPAYEEKAAAPAYEEKATSPAASTGSEAGEEEAFEEEIYVDPDYPVPQEPE